MKQKMSVMILIAVLSSMALVHAFANPAPVDLGAAGNYVVLAETTITTTGTTAIIGDLGLSPNGGSSFTGFGQIMDPSGQFSRSSLVAGKLYAADYTTPTPDNLGTAITIMETAYTTASGAAADIPNLNGGNLGGQSLV
ncbi:MAG: ice-binding family protein, partial [Candidatus ainarchaeum sp.]|nr:ice-binding family protein [Candidatus ainarchaeum sp.]